MENFSLFFGKLKEPQFPSEISWPLYLCFQTKYPQWLGDIRGRGLVIGLEIVSDAETKAPNSPLAVNIMYNLKAEKVLVGISGKQKNVIFISPPLCFTIENSRRYVLALVFLLLSRHVEIEKFDQGLSWRRSWIFDTSVLRQNKSGFLSTKFFFS